MRRWLPMVWLVGAVIAGIFIGAAAPSTSATLLLLTALLISAAVTPLAAWFALLILAPLRTLIETEAAFRLPLEIGQLLVLALVAIWLIYRVSRGQRVYRFIPSPVYLPLLVFSAFLMLNSLSAISFGAWLSEWLKWVIMLVLVALVLNVRHPEWLAFGLVAAAAGNAVVGVYIFLGGSGALHLLINDRFFRAFGTFGQPNPFGGFMGLVAPLAAALSVGYGWRLWQGYRQRRRLDRATAAITLFYAVSAALIAAGVVASWSRGAWLAAGISLLVVMLAIPRRLGVSLVLVTVIMAAGLLLWTSGRLPATIVERISSATAEIFAVTDVRGVDVTPANYAVVERLAHWQAALNMGQANWWTGVGFGNYEVAYPDYRLMLWREPLGHAHNYYLNVMAETGIIGAILYLCLWVSIFWLTWRCRVQPDPVARLMAIGLLGGWTYLTVHSLTDNLYVNNLFLHLGVMLGLLALLDHQTYRSVRLKST